jgi:hypothetical protein
MSLELLEELVQAAPPRKFRDAIRVPSFLEIGYGYRPGRSSGFSLLLHLLAALLIASSSTRLAYVHAAEVVRPRLEPMKIDPLYLPVLGGGSEGSGALGGGSGAATETSSGLRARSHRGFAYPGPQPLVSAPPMAQLGIQTILRPNLTNPPVLHQNFPLPNLAIAAPPAMPEPPKPVMKIEAGRLPSATVEKAVQAPKLTLPTTSTRNLPELASAEPAMPQALPAKPVMKIDAGRLPIRSVEKAVQAPKLSLPAASNGNLPELASAVPVMPQAPASKPVPPPARMSDIPAGIRAKEGLLVLNAIPPSPDTIAKIPLGEARSLFAVAPGETTVIADPAAGTKGGGTSKGSGNGVPSDNPSGDAIADAASGGGRVLGSGGSGTGAGSKYGSGNGSGVNAEAGRAGTGRGAAVGAGAGTGSSTALGSGGGAGNSPGGGGFPGISIRGGSYGNGGGIHTNVISRRQTSYAMTITSTASSGGGLPDYGVFQNQKVYTVYLDMRSSDDDSMTPAWILQYAPLQPSDPSAIRIVGVPTPPYATLKQVPELNGELAAGCAYKLIVVSGVLNVNGRLEQISVKKTPDPRINAVIADALANWMFQPSQIQGNPVALKVMLGIRLAGH